jgi:hypothetical protein
MLVRRRVAQKEIQQNLQYGRSKTLITCCTSQLKDLVTRGEEVRLLYKYAAPLQWRVAVWMPGRLKLRFVQAKCPTLG